MTESIRQVCGVCEHQADALWGGHLSWSCPVLHHGARLACGLEHQNWFSTCEGPGSPRRTWCCLCCCGALVLGQCWCGHEHGRTPRQDEGTWLPLAASPLAICSGIIFLSLLSGNILSCLTHYCPHISVVVSVVLLFRFDVFLKDPVIIWSSVHSSNKSLATRTRLT